MMLVVGEVRCGVFGFCRYAMNNWLKFKIVFNLFFYFVFGEVDILLVGG